MAFHFIISNVFFSDFQIANVNISNAERKSYPRTGSKTPGYKALPIAIGAFFKSWKQRGNVVPAAKDFIDKLGQERGYPSMNV